MTTVNNYKYINILFKPHIVVNTVGIQLYWVSFISINPMTAELCTVVFRDNNNNIEILITLK